MRERKERYDTANTQLQSGPDHLILGAIHFWATCLPVQKNPLGLDEQETALIAPRHMATPISMSRLNF